MLSDVTLNLLDPGLGAVPASAGKTQIKFGVCNKGTPNTLYSAGGINPARSALRSGPLLDASCQVLGVAGGSVLMMPVLPSTYGTVTGAFSLSGSGTGTVTGSKGPEQIVKIKIGATAGALGTMQFQVAIGSGAYGSLVTSVNAPPWSYQIPGQYFTTAIFAAGTYVAGDVYTLNLDGTVTRTGSGTATLLDGSTNSPVDAYEIQVLTTKSGALGAGTFKYSLDGGNTFSGDIGIPSGGKYVIPNTGVVLTFASTFTVDDLYTGTSTAASFGGSDLTAAITAALALPNAWGFGHVVGTPANAAAAASLASTISAQMALAWANYRFVFIVMETPTSESDSTVAAAFASFVDKTVSVQAGDVRLTSALTGQKDRRNGAWDYTARLSNTKLSSHPGQIESSNGGGALVNVKSLYRDEYATPALDAARFVTHRTYVGLPGYYITDGQTMAAPGSDYSSVMNLRVICRTIDVVRFKAMLFLNKPIKVNPSTGFIQEVEARKIESNIRQGLLDTLLAEDEVSGVEVVCSRTDNILATSTLNIEISVIPKGYSRRIVTTIGLKNPVLAAA